MAKKLRLPRIVCEVNAWRLDGFLLSGVLCKVRNASLFNEGEKHEFLLEDVIHYPAGPDEGEHYLGRLILGDYVMFRIEEKHTCPESLKSLSVEKSPDKSGTK